MLLAACHGLQRATELADPEDNPKICGHSGMESEVVQPGAGEHDLLLASQDTLLASLSGSFSGRDVWDTGSMGCVSICCMLPSMGISYSANVDRCSAQLHCYTAFFECVVYTATCGILNWPCWPRLVNYFCLMQLSGTN